jgi:two-component system response regulator MprA
MTGRLFRDNDEVMAGRLLLVNDQSTTEQALHGALVSEGFEVALATSEADALRVVEYDAPDAVIVDVAVADAEGVALCRRLRQAGKQVPVIILGTRDTVGDRIAGLEAGADDYLAKPIVLVELLARLRALLRRTGHAGDGMLRFGDLVLDPGTREVTRATRPIELTLTEFSLLELFLRHPRQVLPRARIFTHVWGFDFAGMSNSLNVYINRLRRKIEAPGEARLIHTVRGVGYVLREP